MGGKQWAKEEELVFWKFVVPKSPKRVGGDRQNREMSWKDCAAWMQRRMAKVYKEPRRIYTELCLCESSFRCLKPLQRADGVRHGQGNGEANDQGNGPGDSDNNGINEESHIPQPLGNAGPPIPMTPARPRSLATQRAKNTDHQEDSPSSMSPFAPGYNNSDGYASIGNQASTPSYTGSRGYADHLGHPKPSRMSLDPSGSLAAPTMPMAPMDEEELPSLAGLRTASPYSHDSPVTPGQYSEVNSSPPMQMPQAMRHHSVIERQAASAGMSVQDLLNSSPAKQHPLPQAYQGSSHDGYSIQSGYNYYPGCVQDLAQGYDNSYSPNYTSNYGQPYVQGYNDDVHSYNQGYDSSPQGHNNGIQGYNQGYDSSPQGHNNGIQGYNQGYESSLSGHPPNRIDDASFPTRAVSSNATRSAHEGATYNNEYQGFNSDNSYQNSSIPNGSGEQSAAYSRRGPQRSVNRA
uniref:Uncharacterized protein 15E11.170 n=1 Tax=Neurospora crassa TaxID=5141 RepID=Q9HEI4_NEUCS|nr:hypothetical protein [Neurospora crassa]